MKNYAEHLGWEIDTDFPNWANNQEYVETISRGYLHENETPKDAYWRVSTTVAKRLNRPDLATQFFDYIWKGWLCLASPVLSNTGLERGLPISCFGVDVADSIQDIGQKNLELMILAKHGGGVGIGINQIRPAGSVITGNGTSDGVVPFCKIYDSTILATSQGNVRRGAASVNLSIEHDDFLEWLEIREPKGDVNRQSLNLHQCVVISDGFMKRLQEGDDDARKRWSALLQQRRATGEPYIMFKGNVNKANPEAYKKNGLKVFMTNICSEIALHTDENHSFVCCLSSVNLSKYDEWKDTNLMYDATWFLDGVLEEFIQKAKHRQGFGNTCRSASKGRALGLGVLGWHTFLQQRGLAFEGMEAQQWTHVLFEKMKEETERASRDLAQAYGEPLWCVGTGFRNSHLRAIAPTVSNSKLAGGVSAGIEPLPANYFIDQSAKGTFIRKNAELEKVLETIGHNTPEVWKQISADGGSVQNLACLDFVCYRNGQLTTVLEHFERDDVPVKDVFKTFKEVNQLALVKQAGIRQKFIDQSVSLNLAFPKEAAPRWINQVHMEGYRQGIKTFYYMRTESSLKGDVAKTAMSDECFHCDG